MTQIRVVIVRGDHGWVAQGLDYDIAAQGASVPEAVAAWAQTIICELGFRLRSAPDQANPLADIPRAPQKYFDLWEHADLQPIGDGKRPIDFAAPASIPAWMIRSLMPVHRVAC